MNRRSRFMMFVLMICLLSGVTSLNQMQAADCGSQLNPCEKLYGVPDDVIQAYPEPEVATLEVDQKLLHDRIYNQVDGRLDIYDNPNGNVVRSLDAGFNFLTSIDRVDDWVEVNPGEWVKADQLTSIGSGISNFTGVLLPDAPLPYPMAWMLINAYPAIEPGGDPNETENSLVYRYTRVNIYATVELEGWNWYQIGVHQWVPQTQVARILPVERPEGVTTDLWVSVDLYEQVLVVHQNDKAIFATLISSGLPRWPTREGIFNITWRRTREDMTWGTPGDDFYYLEEVPWTMFFDEGRALHGEYWHDGLGYRRSHGCVNMSITDAHWLYNLVADYMGSTVSPDKEEGPAVYVYSSGTYIE